MSNDKFMLTTYQHMAHQHEWSKVKSQRAITYTQYKQYLRMAGATLCSIQDAMPHNCHLF